MQVKKELIKNPHRHIWEGWEVIDFINEISIGFEHQRFKDDQELKEYVHSNQPFIKKHIPEVYAYFKKVAHDNNQVGEREW